MLMLLESWMVVRLSSLLLSVALIRPFAEDVAVEYDGSVTVFVDAAVTLPFSSTVAYGTLNVPPNAGEVFVACP